MTDVSRETSPFGLFRHRHRYTRLIPGVLQDPITGGLFPCSRLLCRCGAEDPDSARFRQIICMELP